MIESVLLFLQTTEGIVTASTTIGALLWRLGVLGKRKLIDPVITHIEETKKISKVLPTIELISQEFRPNGGSSMKDQLNRIEALGKITLRMTDKAYWISDQDGLFTEASPSLSLLMGLAPEQILGNGWINALHPKYKKEVENEWDQAIQDKREFHYDFAYKHSTGFIQPVTGHAIPLKYQGKVIGFVGWSTPRLESHEV